MECAMSGCQKSSSSVFLLVEVPHLGSFEVPLCPMHTLEFAASGEVLKEEFDEAQRWWNFDGDVCKEGMK